VDDREFLVVRKGYDKDQVKAYLGEVEASFRQLERWAEEAKARLRLAEEKGRRHYDVDEAMIAVFAAKDRVLERSRLRAERIEAEAREQAGADYEDAAAEIIEGAKEEARHIIAGALTSVRVQYESTLEEARAEADRMIQEARAEADRMIQEARAEADRLVARSQAIVAGSEDAVGDSLVVDLTHDGGADEAEDDDAPRRTRYERRSAKLPSIGEDASDILRSLKSLREDSSTD
jgi:cell division septum initiation protein DivIVA